LKKPAIIKKLLPVLGSEVLVKRNKKIFIDKKRMADAIFKDSRKRRYAEKMIHPEVIKIAKHKKTQILSKKPDAVIVFEVPLLFEGNYKSIFDKIVVVHCNKTKALKRLIRLKISKEQALERMRAQIPTSRKKSQADFLIDNNLTLRNLKPQVKKILKKLLK
jgi:dephospho-CoA kinase